MKDQTLSIAMGEPDPQLATNLLREYLQHLILRELFEQDILEGLVFHGGTALRILFGLNRFSEDLDFHLEKSGDKLNLKGIVERIINHLTLQEYHLSHKIQLEGTVQSSFIKFEDILYEANLTRQTGEKLSIKLEIDTNPPEGFGTEFSLINKYFPFVLVHHDRPTFIAGKLHAILQRSYTKGRDYYDLWFYLGRWKNLVPNFTFLNNALSQTDYKGPQLNADNWKKLIRKRIKEIDWDNIRKDVEPFLQNPKDLKLFQKQILLELL
ncbi:MAG: nucleotidyl transferase AbiEii/AbiGii toxin family protein [candidate division WOR-3 bacterium]|nr:nucleotidyl transferase AbiEii/AbiGii toxin family protein [candidate division WOR-3 bacterium]